MLTAVAPARFVSLSAGQCTLPAASLRSEPCDVVALHPVPTTGGDDVADGGRHLSVAAATAAVAGGGAVAQVAAQVAQTDPPITSRVSRPLAFVARPLARLLYSVVFRKRIIGKENIPASGAVILAPTHQSVLDPPMVCALTNREVHSMTASEQFKWFDGWFMRRLGAFPVDRHHPSPEVLRHARDLMAQKKVLAIYPEGRIRKDGQVHELKNGVVRAGADAIVPITIQYGARRWLRRDLTVVVGKPIYTANYTGEGAAQRILADLHQALRETKEQLSGIPQLMIPLPTRVPPLSTQAAWRKIEGITGYFLADHSRDPKLNGRQRTAVAEVGNRVRGYHAAAEQLMREDGLPEAELKTQRPKYIAAAIISDLIQKPGKSATLASRHPMLPRYPALYMAGQQYLDSLPKASGQASSQPKVEEASLEPAIA